MKYTKKYPIHPLPDKQFSGASMFADGGEKKKTYTNKAEYEKALQAYNDSLNIYNVSKQCADKLKNYENQGFVTSKQVEDWSNSMVSDKNFMASHKRLKELNNQSPDLGKLDWTYLKKPLIDEKGVKHDLFTGIYKKPVVKPEYQSLSTPIMNEGERQMEARYKPTLAKGTLEQEVKPTMAKGTMESEPKPINELMMPSGSYMQKDEFIKRYSKNAWDKATGQKFQNGGKLPGDNVAVQDNLQSKKYIPKQQLSEEGKQWAAGEWNKKLEQRKKELSNYYSKEGMFSVMKEPVDIDSFAEKSLRYNESPTSEKFKTATIDVSLGVAPELLLSKLGKVPQVKQWYDNYHKGTLKNNIPGNAGEYIQRGVADEKAIKDLLETGIVRNRQSAGLPSKGRWGENVYWGNAEDKFASNNYNIIAKNSKELSNRPVTLDDIKDLQIKTSKGYKSIMGEKPWLKATGQKFAFGGFKYNNGGTKTTVGNSFYNQSTNQVGSPQVNTVPSSYTDQFNGNYSSTPKTTKDGINFTKDGKAFNTMSTSNSGSAFSGNYLGMATAAVGGIGTTVNNANAATTEQEKNRAIERGTVDTTMNVVDAAFPIVEAVEGVAGGIGSIIDSTNGSTSYTDPNTGKTYTYKKGDSGTSAAGFKAAVDPRGNATNFIGDITGTTENYGQSNFGMAVADLFVPFLSEAFRNKQREKAANQAQLNNSLMAAKEVDSTARNFSAFGGYKNKFPYGGNMKSEVTGQSYLKDQVSDFTSNKFSKHEQGGVMVDSQNEVEAGEIIYKDYVFSERLKDSNGKSFAERAKKLISQIK